MQRSHLVAGLLAAGLVLLVVSAFPAQQPGTPVQKLAIDPGFTPGKVPTLDAQQQQRILKALQQLQQGKNNVQLAPAGAQGNAQPAAAGGPEAFTSKEGKKGWRIVIPGNRPLATPAFADGKIFLGGGFGSHEFYALDAKTGKQDWVYRTGDDGPTAAIISDDLIAFNTESCELEIITKAGKPVWKKWLGDPLMSMPAAHSGRVYMAYPDSKGGGGHKLACFDIKTGKEHWKYKIAGDIITAPVIDGGKVYLTTVDGTMYCFACDDGKLAWSEKKNATSSPAVHNGKTYFSLRDVRVMKDKSGKEVKQQHEALAALPATTGSAGLGFAGGTGGGVLAGTKRKADYLDAEKRVKGSPREKGYKEQDASVGFATAPAAANLGLAIGNLGQSTVNGLWSYQGSRPFVYKGQLYSSMGDEVKCVNPKTEKVVWKHSVRDKNDKGPLVDAALTPPATVNRKLFIGTSAGQIICLNAEDGKELWRATVGDPIIFQPAVAHGRVFVGTANGRVYCIETGDEDDHGWLMWGANASHNGRPE